MRMKSFVAPSVPEAMQLVRQQLGPEAVVLSTRRDDASGKVRITAALEETPLDELELPGGEADLRSIDDLSERLHFHRVPIGLTDRLLGAAGRVAAGDPLNALAGALDAVLRFAPAPGTGARCPVMLVGPTGAGKTATAAKLAIQARLAGLDCRLITMDTVKAGGLAQITAFAEALEARLEQAADAAALAALFADGAAAGPAPVFTVIDTVGCNPLDPAERRALAATAASVGAEPILVLPAGGDVLETAETAIAFGADGVTGLIPTKLDAARRLGGVLSAAHASGLVLVAAGIAPGIAEGLAPLNPMSLARLLLPRGEAAARTSLLATGTLP